jgi:hypothetical protein
MELWNDGAMEYWVLNMDDVWILISGLFLPYMIRSHSVKSNIPTFQHSYTPWHSIATPVFLDHAEY